MAEAGNPPVKNEINPSGTADRSISLLQATLDATGDGILVVDREGRIAGVNRRFAELWRLPPDLVAAGVDDALLAHSVAQIRDPERFLARVRELYALPEAESFDQIELVDGRVFERYSRPQRLGGEVVGRVWSFRDVTERVRAEAALRESQERLLHAQKMEVVGRLAGGVAHDFNNLLTVIQGHAQLLLDRLPPDGPMTRSARDIQRAAEHAAALTARLLAFSRKQVVVPRVVDLNEVIRGSTALVRRLVREDVTIVADLADRPLWVRADPVEIEQVLFNLAVNARDAMPQGGTLTFRARAEDGRVRVDTIDTGVGMDAATRARVFEPFFTTKEAGRGTGLGLATVRDIVSAAGGDIVVESAPGAGTTFTLTLPLTTDAPEGVAAPPAEAPPEGGREVVLVVDDAPELRALVRDVLEDEGYRVLEAADGVEAVSVGGAEPIDLLVCDVVLPRVSGPDVYAQLRAASPGLRALFMSGYADMGPVVLPAGVPRLAKPFRLDALVKGVREALDHP